MRNKNVVMLLTKDVFGDPRVLAEARSLIRNRYDVTVLAWDRTGLCRKRERYKEVKIERVQLKIPVTRLSILFCLAFFNMFAFLKLISINFDIVHCHDFDTLIAGFLAGSVKKRKIIYDSHEYYTSVMSLSFPQIIVKITFATELSLAKRVDKFITVTERIAKIFWLRGVSRNKISVVMNCKDPEDYEIEDDLVRDLRRKLKAMNKIVILYNGWLKPDNGLEELFDVFQILKSRVKNLLAVICGGGDSEEKFREMVDEKNIKEYIEFIGEIPSDDIPLYVRACDLVYVMYKPIILNNFLRMPIRMFEAIAAGKPVITSNFGEIRQFVERNGIGIVVDPNDVNELCNAICAMIYNEELRKESSRRAKELSKMYNWSVMEKRLLSLYEDL